MNAVFVDTLYWIASINRQDQWHVRALEIEAGITGRRLVTTEAVLIEVLNYFSGYGADARTEAVGIIHDILNDTQVETVAQTRDAFLAGVELYRARPDKGYSLTNCISMNTMRERGIREVLTHDRHFSQEGFAILL